MWRPIVGYEGIYEISRLGEVRRIKTGRILTGYAGRDGYRRVGLTVNSETKPFLLHRLLAIAFIPNPFNYPCVNHKDEDKSNNSLSNLEWCTYRYNLNYGTHNARANESRKKPISQYSKDGKFIRDWNSVTDLRNETGMDITHVSSCCRGKRKSANGFCWQYKNEKEI
jgi:hypothetical protein